MVGGKPFRDVIQLNPPLAESEPRKLIHLLEEARSREKAEKAARRRASRVFIEITTCGACGFEMAYRAVRCPACEAPLANQPTGKK